MYTYVCVCIHIQVCISVCIYIYKYVCIYIYTCKYIHIYIYRTAELHWTSRRGCGTPRWSPSCGAQALASEEAQVRRCRREHIQVPAIGSVQVTEST
jgi:hypothetical protein